ncbi:MAG: HD domain-containing protein [Syntrophorhabdaceae bacterium]|nr:HD domain-containing protein [Syntrophorhabdaceae bacterium]
MDGPLHRLKEHIKRERVVKDLRNTTFNGKVYLVGGAIREIYLDKKPNDYDIVLSDKDDLKRLESLYNTEAFVLGKKPIQTFRIVKEGLTIDITFLNGNIEEDLARRDFTMNGIAYDIHNDRLVDPLKGLEDIGRGIIRCPNIENLKEDPLRMLKAIRHYGMLEGFILHKELMASIGTLKGHIIKTAPERVKYEMDRILISDRVYEALTFLESTGLLFVIFPELQGLKQMDKEKGFSLETFGHTIEGFKYLKKYGESFHLEEKALKDTGYALLFHDLGKAYTFSYDSHKGVVHFFNHEKISNDIATIIMERLRFSQSEIRSIKRIIESHMRIFLISGDEPTERALRRIIFKLEDMTPSLIVHTLCDMYGSSQGMENPSTERVKKRCGEIWEMYLEWKKKPLPRLVNGHDILNLGVVEGPEIGRILHMIKEKQITGEISTREEALSYAGELMGNS